MRKSPKFSPEVIERAVRMVFEAKDQYTTPSRRGDGMNGDFRPRSTLTEGPPRRISGANGLAANKECVVCAE